MHFLLIWLQIFYVPLFAFLAESNSTHLQSTEQSEYVFSSSLNAVIVVINVDISINSYEFGHFRCWVRHQKNVKPNTFGLQLCILVKYYSVPNLHHNSKTIHHIWALSHSHFTSKPFSTQPSPRFYSTLLHAHPDGFFPAHLWFPLGAIWLLRCMTVNWFVLHAQLCLCTLPPLQQGHTICSQDRSSSAEDSLETT